MFLRIFLLSLMVLSLGAVGLVVFNTPAETPAVVAEAAPAPAPKPSTAVLVAARPLSTGTLLRPDDVRWQEWATGDLPEGYIERGKHPDDTIHGAVARRSFVAGEPLMKGQIVLPKDRGFLAAVLTPGRRAVAVAVDAVSAASGLIWPGDHVDVILAQTFNNDSTSPGRRAVGETLLRDLRVLSIDQHLGSVDRSKGTTDQAVPRTVTLEVNAKEAEKIAVATGLGRLSLVLRSLGSDEVASDPGVAESEVSATWAEEVSPALTAHVPAQVELAREGIGVVVVRGSQRAVQ